MLKIVEAGCLGIWQFSMLFALLLCMLKISMIFKKKLSAKAKASSVWKNPRNSLSEGKQTRMSSCYHDYLTEISNTGKNYSRRDSDKRYK